MEKKILKGKKEIRLLIVDSLHQAVNTLGIVKSKKKTERVINKSARRIAELVAQQMKKELKKINEVEKKKAKTTKAKVSKKKKVEPIKEPVLETA